MPPCTDSSLHQVMMPKQWLEQRLNAIWYRGAALGWLLIPLTWLFCGLVTLRRSGYRRGWLAQVAPPLPLIVVGNITVGGSGKSPFVAWLVTQLAARGYHPGIISRGYGGDGQSGPTSVTAGSDPNRVGDEAVMLATQCNLPLVVARDRVAALQHLVRHHPVDIVVSDDGLQHYRLGRTLEIALIDGERGLGNGRCLPAGPLRETARRLQQVDLVVQQGGEPRWSTLRMTLHGERLEPLLAGESHTLAAWRGRTIHAVAGIGHPERFFNALEAAGLKVIRHPFADHHPFTLADLDYNDDLPLVMTAKDGVKCRTLMATRPELAARCWLLPVTAVLPNDLTDNLIAQLEKRRGQKTA
jgi:tetraacyldisaccharide 4'-kinase